MYFFQNIWNHDIAVLLWLILSGPCRHILLPLFMVRFVAGKISLWVSIIKCDGKCIVFSSENCFNSESADTDLYLLVPATFPPHRHYLLPYLNSLYTFSFSTTTLSSTLSCLNMFSSNRPWAGYRPPSPPQGEFCTLWFSETTLYKTQNKRC